MKGKGLAGWISTVENKADKQRRASEGHHQNVKPLGLKGAKL